MGKRFFEELISNKWAQTPPGTGSDAYGNAIKSYPRPRCMSLRASTLPHCALAPGQTSGAEKPGRFRPGYTCLAKQAC